MLLMRKKIMSAVRKSIVNCQRSVVFGPSKVNCQLSKVNCSARGFTLLELLLYTAIFGMTAALMTGILVNVTRVQNREGSASDITEQSQFIFQTAERLVREIGR